MKVRNMLASALQACLRATGYQVTRYSSPNHRSSFPGDFTQSDVDDVLAVRPYTMTSPERICALVRAVEYLVEHRIPGDIVECGVWKGGSMMAIARTLMRLGDTTRNLYLLDTFEGMSLPTDADVAFNGKVAHRTWGKPDQRDSDAPDYTSVPLEAVSEVVYGTGYPREKFRFVRGKVEETVPGQAPEVIALLRLDTDWYESTMHELVHLYPRLVSGGVLVIDDYGHWLGARKATDEYLGENRIPLLLQRIDYTARFAIKR